MNTPSFLIKLLPKHPEVTGTPNQIFSFAKDFGTMVLKLIQTKTIAFLGTITTGSTTLHYLFNPMINHDLTKKKINHHSPGGHGRCKDSITIKEA
jgi:hypothetical protein